MYKDLENVPSRAVRWNFPAIFVLLQGIPAQGQRFLDTPNVLSHPRVRIAINLARSRNFTVFRTIFGHS